MREWVKLTLTRLPVYAAFVLVGSIVAGMVVDKSFDLLAAPNPKVKALGKAHKVKTEHGDELVMTPVTLDDGTPAFDVVGGTLPDGSGMAAPDVQPTVKVGQRVKKEKRGKGWRLVPEDSPEASLGVAVAYAYSYGGHAWKDHTLRYYTNTTSPPPPSTMTAAQQQASLAAAAQRWVDQTGAALSVVSAGLTTNNVVAGNHHSDVFWREGSSDVAGRAAATYFYWGSDGYLWDADMMTWKGWGAFYPLTTCAAGSFRAFADEIWTHEFGHFVGFGHSAVSTATMWPSIPSSCAGNWRSLDPDDAAAALAAYGPAPVTAPPPASALYGPKSGATATDQYLRWYKSVGATTYDVSFGTDPNALALVKSLTPPSCTCVSSAYAGTLYLAYPPTQSGKVYYWRVVAKNALGETASPIWSFVGK